MSDRLLMAARFTAALEAASRKNLCGALAVQERDASEYQSTGLARVATAFAFICPLDDQCPHDPSLRMPTPTPAR